MDEEILLSSLTDKEMMFLIEAWELAQETEEENLDDRD